MKPHALQEHSGDITGRDRALEHDHTVLCRSWKDGVWALTLVTLRINHAATFVKWSPLKNKFAVESAKQFISVCHLDIKMTSG